MKKPAKNEKVTDAVLAKSILASVIGILLCMACLAGTTWAWFSSSVTSGVSVTTGANFDFTVGITDNVEPDGTDVYAFAGGTHTVTLTKKGTAEKGFCKVVATKDGEEAETATYYIVDFTDAGNITFTVNGSGTLKLIPMLGTPAEGYTQIPEGGIELTPDPAAKTLLPETGTPPDGTALTAGGETGTSGETTTEADQTTPDANTGETPADAPSEGTSTDPETADLETTGPETAVTES